MITHLRNLAAAAERSAYAARVDYYIRHGHENPQLYREFHRMRVLVEMIDEHITLTQAEDADAMVLEPRMTPDPGDHYVGMA